jgi:hypothetical protein
VRRLAGDLVAAVDPRHADERRGCDIGSREGVAPRSSRAHSMVESASANTS